jgi:threonine dehydrogenase-like Zn-dependent dehydrogenase
VSSVPAQRCSAADDRGADDGRSSPSPSLLPGAGTAGPPSAVRVTTEALLLNRDLTLSLGTRQLLPPAAGEALVRVAWAGVCGSDLHVLRTGEWVAYWPATLGHEVVGVVDECPGAEIAPGTAVVVDSRLPCGGCAGCQKAPSLCHNMSWLGEARPGGFARHLVVPVTSLVPCPSPLEPAIAVLAEPLAVAMHAVSRLPHAPDDALLLGYGPIGALVHLELARRWPGLSVYVSEASEARCQLALALGARLVEAAGPARQTGISTTATTTTPTATTTTATNSTTTTNSTSTTTSPMLFSLVVDAAGYPGSLADACNRAANGGSVLLVALSFEGVDVVPAHLVERSLTVAGSVGFDDELDEALILLAADPDRYRPLVSEAVLLEEAAERLAAMAQATEPSAGKVLVRPWSA